MSSGRIVQIIGAVIDVEFPRDQVPNIYEALKVVGAETTLEVQQQLSVPVLLGLNAVVDDQHDDIPTR